MDLRTGVYQHYKGDYYQVLGVGAHTETDEHFVVYVPLTTHNGRQPGPRIRLRPAGKWEDSMEWPGGTRGPRFKYVGLEIPAPCGAVCSCPCRQRCSGKHVDGAHGVEPDDHWMGPEFKKG